MTLRDTVRNWMMNFLDLGDPATQANRERMDSLAMLRDYYDGLQKAQLRVKSGKFDDNLTINLCGLIVDKSVSALVGDPADGQGLTWTFPSETEDTTPPSVTWLDELWQANHRDEWLHKNALQGAMTGFPAVKIVPNGSGDIRLVNINPLILTVETDPSDLERIIKYIILYHVTEGNKETTHKEETFPDNPSLPAYWTIETSKKIGGEKWELVGPPVKWEYDFAPILTWQNLPVIDSPYGRSDIEGIIPIQDRYNFLVSNLSKIIRLYAHPQRYSRGLTANMVDNEFKMGPDEMPGFTGEGEIIQLPPVGDLPGAMQFLQSLRESAFMLSREVDTLSMKDKVGAITNFALRVLYRDFLDKLGTKRMLYGSAYIELNKRLLVLGGFEPEECTINWPDALPTNEVEETTALKADMELGLCSKQTAAEKRGYDFEDEQERIGEEGQSSDNAGGLILSNFFKNNNQPRTQPAESVENAIQPTA